MTTDMAVWKSTIPFNIAGRETLVQRTLAAHDEIQNVQVFAAEHVPVAPLAVGVAVQDCRCGSCEEGHIKPLGQRVTPHPAPLPQAKGERLHRLRINRL